MRPVNKIQVTGSRSEGGEQEFKNRGLSRFPWEITRKLAGFKGNFEGRGTTVRRIYGKKEGATQAPGE
jgi:hypothetical protein